MFKAMVIGIVGLSGIWAMSSPAVALEANTQTALATDEAGTSANQEAQSRVGAMSNTTVERQGLEHIDRAVPTDEDRKLSETVRTSLEKDNSLRPSLQDIQLKTVNGVVYLKGNVPSEQTKSAIENAVKTCPGVSRVSNHIHVGAV